MNSSRPFLGGLFTLSVLLAVVGQTTVEAADFQADLDALYYHDSASRTLNWDLSSGTVDGSGVVTIPASWDSGAVLTLQPDGGLTSKSFSSSEGVYHLAIPPATPGIKAIPTAASDVTVDGSPDDWADIEVYIQDPVGDVWWAGVPSGADVEYLKLAYSSDQSELYILLKLTENANPDLWYRLVLRETMEENEGLPGVFLLDIQGGGMWWGIYGTGWYPDGSSYQVPNTDVGGLVAVSGPYLEASINTAPFGLPTKARMSGTTALASDFRIVYDQFVTNFKTTAGAVYLNGGTVTAPTTWTTAARIRGFANWAFEGTCPYMRFAGVVLSGETLNNDGLIIPQLQAFWVTGDFDGTEVSDALVLMARVDKGGGGTEYHWRWNPLTSDTDGVVVTGLNPSTTVLDLKLDVTNNGRTVTFYYRTNSTSALNAGTWLTATSHTLTAGTGAMYGVPTTYPHVELETGFNRAAPVYRFWNKIFSRHIYTMSRAEKAKLLALPYFLAYEGIQYYTYFEDSDPQVLPIYRFWSDSKSAHFYTINEAEKNKLISKFSSVWTYEGPVFCAFSSASHPADAVAVYRFWSDSLNCHFYTTNAAERDKLISKFSSVWTYEGPMFYTLPWLFNEEW